MSKLNEKEGCWNRWLANFITRASFTLGWISACGHSTESSRIRTSPLVNHSPQESDLWLLLDVWGWDTEICSQTRCLLWCMVNKWGMRWLQKDKYIYSGSYIVVYSNLGWSSHPVRVKFTLLFQSAVCHWSFPALPGPGTQGTSKNLRRLTETLETNVLSMLDDMLIKCSVFLVTEACKNFDKLEFSKKKKKNCGIFLWLWPLISLKSEFSNRY